MPSLTWIEYVGTVPGLRHEFEIVETIPRDAFLLMLPGAGVDLQAIHDALNDDYEAWKLTIPGVEIDLAFIHATEQEAMAEAERVARLLLERQASPG
jgi:hypothetical protein